MTGIPQLIRVSHLVLLLLLPPDSNSCSADDRNEKRHATDGALPSNTVPNPREQINSITTRSGLTIAEPSIPPHALPTPRGKLNKTKLVDKNDVQVSKFLKILKQLHFDISLMDALTQILKYHKVLKDLLKDKEKLEELANTPINAKCSTILLNKVPEKLEDPEKFLIPCILQDLRIEPLKPTRMTLELANRSVTYPMGITEDVIVKVEKINFLADFVIVDFEDDPKVPIILGRPFLRTAKALVDLYEEKLTLRVGNEQVVLYNDKSLRNNSRDIQSVHCINVINCLKDKPISGSTTSPSDSFPSSPLDETSDYSLEEFADELALLEPFPPGNEDDNFDHEADLREIEYLLNRDSSIDFSPKTDIDISDPILERFTDELALVSSFTTEDEDDCDNRSFSQG
ncbi:reverse transcriptase domain-containing protein [Tanacetum coccineum]